MITNKEIVLYGEEEGFVNSYPTLWDAYYGFKEIKEFNRRHGASKDNYYWQFEYTKDGQIYERGIKFYVRNGKMYYKFI